MECAKGNKSKYEFKTEMDVLRYNLRGLKKIFKG